MTADDWARAADQLQLQDFYPGIQAVALARYATPQTLPALIEQIHASGRERFRMYPAGERDEYVVTDYIHPTDWRNRRVLGLTSSAKRPAAAIISSRDSGNPVLTGPLRLKQETEQNVQSGVLLFPLYAPSAPATEGTSAGSCRHAAWGLPPDRPDGGHPGFAQPDAAALFDAANPDSPLLAGRAQVSADAAVPAHHATSICTAAAGGCRWRARRNTRRCCVITTGHSTSPRR